MLMIMTIYGTVKMFTRMIVYCGIGGLVLIVRHHNRKKRRNEMDEGTKWIMRNTPKDENGKYPWEK
ncbi:hypothetical protein ACA609_12230 [Lactiplantibacillus plantarum]|uniref:hypothetical protein n=1 Tax=Lactiplantibacillus plantarum TaxID=1590 RepID=UPI003C1E2185